MATILRDLDIDEISLVDKAANKRRFTVYKAADYIPEGTMKDFDVTTLSSGGQAYVESLQGNISTLEKKSTDLEAKITELQKGSSGPPPKEDVLKDVDPAVKLVVKAMEDRLTAAETATKAAKEQVERFEAKDRRTAAIQKAQELQALGFTADSDAEMFEKLEAADPDAFAKVHTKLKAANAQMDESNERLFRELGSLGGEAGSAYDKLAAAATELQKNDSTLTKEQAFARVYRDKPGLAAEYQLEQEQRKRGRQ